MKAEKAHKSNGSSGTVPRVFSLAANGNLLIGIKNQRRYRRGKPRLLRTRPMANWSYSPRRINAITRGLPGARRYLEVGIATGRTLENIDFEVRWGVDPSPQFDLSQLPKGLEVFNETSDAFFAHLADDENFDVVFLDGLHTFEQTYRDLINTLNHLHDGAVLIDDTVPLNETSAIPDLKTYWATRKELGLKENEWQGDVFKLVLYIDRRFPHLDFRTIVGSGNPQTLVWRTGPGVEVDEPDDAFTEIAERSYGDVFANGVPESFRPCSEEEAISACLSVVGPRFR